MNKEAFDISQHLPELIFAVGCLGVITTVVVITANNAFRSIHAKDIAVSKVLEHLSKKNK